MKFLKSNIVITTLPKSPVLNSKTYLLVTVFIFFSELLVAHLLEKEQLNNANGKHYIIRLAALPFLFFFFPDPHRMNIQGCYNEAHYTPNNEIIFRNKMHIQYLYRTVFCESRHCPSTNICTHLNALFPGLPCNGHFQILKDVCF